MTKKILSLLLCVAIMATGFAACAALPPEKELSNIMAKMNSAGNVDANCTAKIKMDLMGQTMEIPVEIGIKMKDANKDTLAMEMNTSMAMGEEKMDLKSYYDKGYLYMDTNGQKIKQAVKLEDVKQQAMTAMNYQGLTDEMYTEVTMEQSGDNKVFSFTGDKDKMNEYLTTIVSSLTGNGEGVEYDFTEVKGTVTVDKSGQMKEFFVAYGANMVMEGQTVTVGLEMTSVINAVGDKVELAMPNFDEYVETPAA